MGRRETLGSKNTKKQVEHTYPAAHSQVASAIRAMARSLITSFFSITVTVYVPARIDGSIEDRTKV